MKEKLIRFIRITSKFKSVLMAIMFIFIIPMACSFMLGYEMQAHQIKNIPTAIVDHDNSFFSQMLIREIKTNETFNVINYSNNDYDIKNLMDEEKIKVGVIIPKSFSKDLTDGKAPKVLIFYDGSQMSIESFSKSRMEEILLSIKTAYLEQIMQGKLGIMPEVSQNHVLPMYFTYRLLNNPTRNYTSFLLPGLLISVVQVALVMLGADMAKEEKLYVWLWLKGVFYGILGAVSIALTLWIQVKYFGTPFRGTIQGAIILTLLYSMGMVFYGALIRLILVNKIFSLQVAAVTVLPLNILGGYTFPLLAMPEVFQKMARIEPFVYYAESIRDLCLKNLDLKYVLPEVNWLFKFLIYMWIASFVVFILKKIIKNRLKYILGNIKKQKQSEEVVQV
jgi:ABC-2 type transport system permease protein